MKKSILLFFILLTVFLAVTENCLSAEHRLGGGANYWMAIDDIDTSNVDDKGFSFLASYQYWTDFVGLEANVEFLPDRFGESAFAPEAYILVGRSLYAGLGIGMIYSDGSFADEPFFALRAGLNLELISGLYLDISGNYRFNDSAEMNNEATDIDTDTVFLGAAVRLSL